MAEFSLDALVAAWAEAQQILADQLGLAVPTEHGKPLMLYDIWEQRLVEVHLNKGTSVRKQNGKVTVRQFSREQGKEVSGDAKG